MQLHIFLHIFQFFQFIFVLPVLLAIVQTAFCQTDLEFSKRIAEIAEANAANDSFSGSVLVAKSNKIGLRHGI